MLVEIANGSLVEGDPTGALQTLVRAEEEDPTLPELYHSKALAYYGKHDLASALQAVRRSLKIKPNYSDANTTLGKILMDMGKFDEAEGPLEIAAKDPLYRDAYKAWTNLGILKYKLGHFRESQAFLDHAILDAPLQACIAYYYRGHIQLKESKFNAAIHDYGESTKKLCAHYRELSDAHLALGVAYQHNRQYDLARKTFLEIQKQYPNTQLAEKAMDQLRYLP